VPESAGYRWIEGEGFVWEGSRPSAELEFAYRLLELFEFEGTEGLWWRYGEGPDDHTSESGLRFYAQCSDTFDWATADCEEITPERLPALEQAKTDLRNVDGGWRNDMWLGELYSARVRNRRPMRAFLKGLQPQVRALFEAAGPERDG